MASLPDRRIEGTVQRKPIKLWLHEWIRQLDGFSRRRWYQPDRGGDVLASAFHAKATTGTIRAQLINIPARLARSARRLRMHLPQHWPWEQAWSQLFQATLAPPRPT